MAEHNYVLKLPKDGMLSKKPYAGGKTGIWQDFVQATHSPAMIVYRLYVIVLGYVTF